MKVIVFSPIVDVIVFSVFFYGILYYIFIRFFKNQIIKIVVLDVQWFIILSILFYLNYHEKRLFLFGDEISMFLFAILLATAIETIYYMIFAKKLGLKKNLKNK